MEAVNEVAVNLEEWKASRVLARPPDNEGYLPACIKGVRANKDVTVQVNNNRFSITWFILLLRFFEVSWAIILAHGST